MSATPRGPDARTAYLAMLREKLIAKRDGGDVITPSTVIAAPTFTLAATAPTAPASPPEPEPEPVQSTQASPYGDMGNGGDDLPRPDDHHVHVELAGLASALSSVAERLGEVARALRGQ